MPRSLASEAATAGARAESKYEYQPFERSASTPLFAAAIVGGGRGRGAIEGGPRLHSHALSAKGKLGLQLESKVFEGPEEVVAPHPVEGLHDITRGRQPLMAFL